MPGLKFFFFFLLEFAKQALKVRCTDNSYHILLSNDKKYLPQRHKASLRSSREAVSFLNSFYQQVLVELNIFELDKKRILAGFSEGLFLI
jgi:hypothetical protein